MAEITPKGLRLHIGIFGRRNVGKSSLLNALTRQVSSIVSDVAGTTTDPVEKVMEMLPLGPVVFIDTAGVDDVGDLGALRAARTRQVFDRTELAVVVAAAGEWNAFEDQLIAEFQERNVPIIVVFNKRDLAAPDAELCARLHAQKIAVVEAVAAERVGVNELRDAFIRACPEEFLQSPPILSDLIPPGELAVLVVPIDKEAPKGRLILPQVQAIRDLLDAGCQALVLREHELRDGLARLTRPPALVVTDSQAFHKVAADTPPDVPLTSFSILFARFKGDLASLAQGAYAIASLKPGDRVLIAEACSHHPIVDDIGTEKIPRWLREYVGGPLEFDHMQGHDFPADVSRYALVIHCGACVQNRREVLTRIERCRSQGVPMTNYGLAIAFALGIIDRVLAPFPAVTAALQAGQASAEVPELQH